MTNETWRPLGVDTEDDVAEYDALHDGLPLWMASTFWEWVRMALTVQRRGGIRSDWVSALDVELVEAMGHSLRLPLPNLRVEFMDYANGKHQLDDAVDALRRQAKTPLQIADYLLAHDGHAKAEQLATVLERSKSAYTVGTRAGRPGLVRRVPLGVQTAADSVMARAGRAGVRLAKAWEELYGLTPRPSEAYRQAILAVEDAAIPVVSPAHASATLGSVLGQMEGQKDWRLPMDREHGKAPTGEVLVGMMRVLWHGQHDRHGGQPTGPGNVSVEEATVAVSLAVAIVNLFESGLVARGSAPATPDA